MYKYIEYFFVWWINSAPLPCIIYRGKRLLLSNYAGNRNNFPVENTKNLVLFCRNAYFIMQKWRSMHPFPQFCVVWGTQNRTMGGKAMRCRRPRRFGYYTNPLAIIAIAFGVGIVMALFCSLRFVLVIAGVLMICMGCACCRWRPRREAPMKIVVVKSPRFLAGILRMIFKIEKEPA